MEVEIGRHSVMFQAGTPSDISIISEETWKKIGSPMLQEAHVKALNALWKRMKFKGKFTYQYGFRERNIQALCYWQI